MNVHILMDGVVCKIMVEFRPSVLHKNYNVKKQLKEQDIQRQYHTWFEAH